MPRNYQRKTKKGMWTSDTLKRAIQSVQKKELSIRLASQRFNIPFTTLQNRLKKNNVQSAKFGRKPVLSFEQEKEIAEHLLKLSRMFYGLTKKELRRTVYSYVTANSIPNPFNQASKMAGRDWLKGFLKRNKKISIRKPEATSINRIKAFNKIAVSRFYENLEDVMKTYNFQPDRIFNVDETGVTTVHEPEPILAEKGVKQVGAATSGERGKTHTACCCVSASGFYVPPMIIYPRVRMSPKLMIDGPPGAIYRCSKSGWINETLFLEWLEHFANKTNASKEDPVLLIMDNHTSHISIEAYDFCVANGIHVVTLPPHTSHKLQPLDRTVFGPFQSEFDVESETEMKSHAYQALTSEQIPSLFRKAWTKICSTEKAVNGFKCTGIYPFNPNLFSDDEYYQLEPEELEENLIEPEETLADIEESSDENDEETNDYYDRMNGSEIVDDQLASAEPNSEGEKVVGNETVEQISFSTFAPLPQKQKAKKTKRGRPKQSSEIVTSPTYKTILEDKREKKIIREQKKATAIRNRFIKGERFDTPATEKTKKTSVKRPRKPKTSTSYKSKIPAELSSTNDDGLETVAVSARTKRSSHFNKKAISIKNEGDEPVLSTRTGTKKPGLKNDCKAHRKISAELSSTNDDGLETVAVSARKQRSSHFNKKAISIKNEGDEPVRSFRTATKKHGLKHDCKEPRKIPAELSSTNDDGLETVAVSARKQRSSHFNKKAISIKNEGDEPVLSTRTGTKKPGLKNDCKAHRKISAELSSTNDDGLETVAVSARKQRSSHFNKKAISIKNEGDKPVLSSRTATKKPGLKNDCKEPRKISTELSSINDDGLKTVAVSARKKRPSNLNEKTISVKNEGDDCASVKTTTNTAKKRRVPAKEQTAKPGVSVREKSARVANSAGSASQTSKSIELNELLDGLCFLCGEKYQAEFFVCTKCNDCVHVGCCSEQGIIDEICSECTINDTDF